MWRRTGPRTATPSELVISKQHERSVRAREDSHTVRISRNAVAVGHGLTTLIEDDVGKSLGQIETSCGIGNERAATEKPRAPALAARKRNGKARAPAADDSATQECPSSDASRNAHDKSVRHL